jgi:hypothetical protein
MMDMGMPVDDVLYAAKEAGRQLVRDGEMSDETLSTISRELMPREMYAVFKPVLYRRVEEAGVIIY